MTVERSSPRANIYIDGFNLYHGCFDNFIDRPHWRQYRWLDVHALCRNFCVGYTIGRIRYFTALVDEMPPGDPANRERQLVYWRALRTIQHLTIHEGKFATNAKWRPLADPSAPKSKPTLLLPVRTAYIIEREEKGSDANLASYLLLDAFKEEYELAVIVSNDFDLAEPIQLVRNEFGRQVCIVNPRKKIARGLQGIADHYMNVRFEMVKQAQFAPTLTDANGTFRKPDRWN